MINGSEETCNQVPELRGDSVWLRTMSSVVDVTRIMRRFYFLKCGVADSNPDLDGGSLDLCRLSTDVVR